MYMRRKDAMICKIAKEKKLLMWPIAVMIVLCHETMSQ